MAKREKEIYRPGRRVAFRKIDGSFVLVDIESNQILRLNDAATEIWGLLDGRDVAGVAAGLAAAFDVPLATALADAREFLELLRSRGLVDRGDGG